MIASVSDLDLMIRSARILLVGAEFGTRKMMRTLLLSAGSTDVHDAADGEAGLAAVAMLDPNVVILEWAAAGMRGAEFVRRLRALDRPSHANVPIIMLTDHNAPAQVAEAMRLGVHEFLMKPVSAAALRERLASVLMTARPRHLATAPSLQPQDEPLQVDAPSADVIVTR
jgi:PleD family two-component response regulator